MILNVEQVKKITFGTERIGFYDGFFSFYRFSESQIDSYSKYKNDDLNKKARASAGVRFSFLSDTKFLSFDCALRSGSSRSYAYFDIYENGALICHAGKEEIDDEMLQIECAFSDGEKHIEVYFPWSASVKLSNISISDGAFIERKERKNSILCFGDSITQGYDAIYPSLSYVNNISRYLDADPVNKAIGGEIFFPELVDGSEVTMPDIVTVAYGTNDWSKCGYEVFCKNCSDFMARVNRIYPLSRVYVIAPIWRADGNDSKEIGIKNNEMVNVIRKICREYPRFKIIDGQNLIPHLPEFFSDKVLHPNDLGFGVFSDALAKELF